MSVDSDRTTLRERILRPTLAELLLRPTRERILRPTLAELWTFLAIALPVLGSLIATLSAVDLAYQLRAGAEILGGSGIPAVDSWTFTAAGSAWFDQQWGAQVILAQVYAVAGWTGLALLRAALVGLISGLILLAIRLRAPGIHPRTAALLALAAFVVMAPALALRPQLLAMALFALTLALLAARRAHPRAIWLVPVITVAWANLHGSFILAPALVGIALVELFGDRDPGGPAEGRPVTRAGIRRTLIVLVATIAATVATPFGWRVWEYAVGIARNAQITAQISEWQPPRFTDVPGLLFWGSLALTGLAVVRLSMGGRRVCPEALVGLIGFALLGALASRGVAWWPGVAVVTVAGLWSDGRRSSPNDHNPDADDHRPDAENHRPDAEPARGRRLNALVGAILIAAGIALIPAWRPVDAGTGAPVRVLTDAPSGITRALRAIAQPGDRVWNPQVWGSWLEFAVPDPLYALDSRIEVIPAETWADAALVAAGEPGWPDILARAGASIVITEGQDSPLAAALGASPEWTVAYADEDGAIWQQVLHTLMRLDLTGEVRG